MLMREHSAHAGPGARAPIVTCKNREGSLKGINRDIKLYIKIYKIHGFYVFCGIFNFLREFLGPGPV